MVLPAAACLRLYKQLASPASETVLLRSMWRLWKQRLGFRWLPQGILAQTGYTITTNSRKACFLKLLFPAHAQEGSIDCTGIVLQTIEFPGLRSVPHSGVFRLWVTLHRAPLRLVPGAVGVERALTGFLCRGMCRAFAAPGEEAPQGAQQRLLVDSVWNGASMLGKSQGMRKSFELWAMPAAGRTCPMQSRLALVMLPGPCFRRRMLSSSLPTCASWTRRPPGPQQDCHATSASRFEPLQSVSPFLR